MTTTTTTTSVLSKKVAQVIMGLLMIAAFSNKSFGQNVYYLSNETFPNAYNNSATGNQNTTFTGSTGTWTSYSNRSYASVAVINYYYNWSSPNCLFIKNFKGTSASTAQATSPAINLSGYSCSPKVWLSLNFDVSKLDGSNTGTVYKIEFSKDGGTTWATVQQQTAAQLKANYSGSGFNNSSIAITSDYLVSNFKYRITGSSPANSSYDCEIYFDDLQILAEPCRTSWTNSCTDNKNVDLYSKGMKNSCASGSLGWTNIGSAEGLNMTNATKVVAYVSMSETGAPGQTVTVRAKNAAGTVLQSVTATLVNNQDDPSDINIYEATFTTLTNIASFEASISGACSLTSSTNPSYIANGLGLAVFRSSVTGMYNQGELKYWGAPGNGTWDYYRWFDLPSTSYTKVVTVQVGISGLTATNGKLARIKIDYTNTAGSGVTKVVDVTGNGSNGDRITLKNIVLTDVNASSTGLTVYTDQSATNNDVYSLDAIKVSTSCSAPLNLGNIVWYDADNNGLKGSSESVIVGATVKVYNDDNGDNVPDGAAIATTMTNSSGVYAFQGLAPGKYIVGVVLPAGYAAGATTTTSSNPDNDTDNDNNGVNLTSDGKEIRSNYITLSVGGEPATAVDGDGTNGNLTMDFGLSLNTTGPCSGAFNPTYTAQGYDLFIQQGLTLVGGHTDGSVAAGGNLTLNGASVLAMNNSGSYPNGYNNDNNYSVVIGGRMVYTSGGLTYVNNGNIKLASTTGSTVWDTDPNGASVNLRITSNASTGFTAYNSTPALQLNGQQAASTVTTPPSGLDFTNSFTTMVANATTMSGYSASSPCSASLNIITVSGTTPTITLAANKVNVVNITGAAFNAITQITYTTAPTSTSPLIFNINQTGSFTLTSHNIAGLANTDGKYIIYNLYNNTGTITVNASNTIIGTLFAPSATVVWNGSNNLEGQIIAKSASLNGGEIHSQIFNACLPNCLPSISISGNVYDAIISCTPTVVGGVKTNVNNTLYANLVGTDNKVVASVAVTSTGTFTFSSVAGNTNYNIILTSGSRTAGSTLTAAALPSNYQSVMEYLGTGAGNDGTPNSILAVATAATSITNANFEIAKDTDGDGIPDYIDIDDDNDGITDLNENGGIDPLGDCDCDGIPNYLDTNNTGSCTFTFTDCNGDGINDLFDWDRDGVMNQVDLDSDNDGILDVVEARTTKNIVIVNGMITGTDADKNGLLSGGGTGAVDNGSGFNNPMANGLIPQDLDKDGFPNFLDLDSDGDGLTDKTEALGVYDTDGLADGTDTDGDGVRSENFGSTAAATADNINGFGAKGLTLLDTDGDGIPDCYDIDSDNDGITDNAEAQATCSYKLPVGTDCDGDGVDDSYDATSKCVTCVRSSAGLTPYDKDGDGTPDYRDLDTDNDGAPDIYEGHTIPGTGGHTIPPNNYWTGATGDADGDGLMDYFDGFNMNTATANYWRNVINNNMGNGGSWDTGTGGTGSISQLPESDGLGGCSNGGERDWRTTTILPVSLLSFTGNLNNNTTKLTWAVTQEINMNYYEVERSLDGTNFTKVGASIYAINANATTSTITYNFNDDVSNLAGTVVYYRLKMTEKGGSYRNSNVISFKLNNKIKESIAVNPNPAVSYFTLKINATKDAVATVRVMDMIGKVLISQTNKVQIGTNAFTFNNISNFSAGTYNVQVVIDGVLYNEKLIVTK